MTDTAVDPLHDSRYRAVAAKDARFDGVFFTAVRTTGIYCRPSCSARRSGTTVGRAMRLIRDGVVEREPDRRGVTAEQRWRPWRSYAGLHLWRSATTPERITP